MKGSNMDQNVNLPRNDDGSLMSYAFPGGYTIYYVCQDGSTLCANCANEQEQVNAANLVDRGENWNLASETIIGVDCNYEDCHLYCDNCSKRIEPSYLTDDDCENRTDD